MWQTAGDVGQELLETVSPLGSKPPPPPQFENDTKMYPIDCSSQAAEETQTAQDTAMQEVTLSPTGKACISWRFKREYYYFDHTSKGMW